VIYRTSFGDKSFQLIFPENYVCSALIESNKHVLAGLILNDRFPPTDEKLKIVCTNDYLEKLLKEVDYPKSPKEKFLFIMLYLESLQIWDGKSNVINPDDKRIYNKLFLRSSDEFEFYLKSLKGKEFISLNRSGSEYNVSITFEGLNYIIENQNSHIISNKCFVAMSFSREPAILAIREAIKAACESCNFVPILADEYHHETDVTVNDFMLKSMKESRFIIADFTEQKDGVYFEAGYGMGRGIKVILTCRNDFFEESHFDTSHYPHITYDTPNELCEKLINKIGAWIL